jgi:ABC-type phosphate transport system ATPase subunit
MNIQQEQNMQSEIKRGGTVAFVGESGYEKTTALKVLQRFYATDKEISDSARMGNVHNYMMTLQKNNETFVQQILLSGGQKQRICISKAINFQGNIAVDTFQTEEFERDEINQSLFQGFSIFEQTDFFEKFQKDLNILFSFCHLIGK